MQVRLAAETSRPPDCDADSRRVLVSSDLLWLHGGTTGCCPVSELNLIYLFFYIFPFQSAVNCSRSHKMLLFAINDSKCFSSPLCQICTTCFQSCAASSSHGATSEPLLLVLYKHETGCACFFFSFFLFCFVSNSPSAAGSPLTLTRAAELRATAAV